MVRSVTAAALAGILAAGAAAADPVSGDAARALVFAPQGVEVAFFGDSGLTEADRTLLGAALGEIGYYAAVAFPRGQGVMAQGGAVAGNHHSPEAAITAALAECRAKRAAGAPDCAPAAVIRPRGWEARPLQMSGKAAAALGREYRNAARPRALALSAATGGWGVGSGADAAAAAISACVASVPEARPADCAVAVAD